MEGVDLKETILGRSFSVARAAFKSVGALGLKLIGAPLNIPKNLCVTCIVLGTQLP